MSSTLVHSTCRRAPTAINFWNRSILYRAAATAVKPAPTTEANGKEQSKSNKTAAAPTIERKPKISNSFVLNLYRGEFFAKEVFPYPNVMNEEQKENIKMLIDPVWKFFEERNDPAKNDHLETVSDVDDF